MMKKTRYALAAAAVFSAIPVMSHAEAASPLTFNVGATSDYRYRGISQTRKKPAIQGGIDYALASGFYVGTWASSIKWIKDAGGGADAEVDVYGGYKGSITKELTYDVGVLRYQYFSHDLAVSPNTTEIYGALTYGPATLKYSHSVTNLFGFADSKNSGYLDLSASFDVGGGVMLMPHVGHQKVAHNSDFSYTDYSLLVGRDFNGFFVSAGVVGADTEEVAGVPVYTNPKNGKDMGKVGAVISVKYTF